MTPAVRALVTQLLARLSSLEARLETSERRVAELEKENRDLRQRLATNSSNSSIALTSDCSEPALPVLPGTPRAQFSSNNIAEQTIRKAVIFSTVETCQRQGLAAFDYIRTAVKTLFEGKTAPRLLPAG
ncbi:MAG: hypothetical protein RL215_1518 [Planctomycetota bacterium]